MNHKNNFGNTSSRHLTWKQPVLGPLSVCQRLLSRFNNACSFQHDWTVAADKRASSGIFYIPPYWSPANSFLLVDNLLTAITQPSEHPPPIRTTTLPVFVSAVGHTRSASPGSYPANLGWRRKAESYEPFHGLHTRQMPDSSSTLPRHLDHSC
jgi:hypothetical protein